jgi:hypothetical protein
MAQKERTWNQIERTTHKRSQERLTWTIEIEESRRDSKKRRKGNGQALMARKEKAGGRTEKVWATIERRAWKAAQTN